MTAKLWYTADDAPVSVGSSVPYLDAHQGAGLRLVSYNASEPTLVSDNGRKAIQMVGSSSQGLISDWPNTYSVKFPTGFIVELEGKFTSSSKIRGLLELSEFSTSHRGDMFIDVGTDPKFDYQGGYKRQTWYYDAGNDGSFGAYNEGAGHTDVGPTVGSAFSIRWQVHSAGMDYRLNNQPFGATYFTGYTAPVVGFLELPSQQNRTGVFLLYSLKISDLTPGFTSKVKVLKR